MSNAVVANYLTPTNADHFNAIWKLSRALKKAGWIYKSSSDGTAKDTTGTATNDKWGPTAASAALSDAIPTLGSGAWWVAQGPSTLKVPIVVSPTGNFIRGENVTQSATGATGELLGVVFDPVGLTGWAVIAPRVDGSGADPHGWNHTNAITGDLSSASLTPSATIIEFVTELVLWKGTNLVQGSFFFQCVDTVAEATSRYSALASAAGCTATIAPGGGGTSNAFPTLGSWAVLGAGGSQAGNWWTLNQHATPQAIGRCQIMVANATPGAGVTGDGSFIMAFGNPGLSASAFTGFALQRIDDQEDGDVCPYVSLGPVNTAVNSVTAATAGTTSNLSTGDFSWNIYYWGRTSQATPPPTACLKSWRRRGMASGDAFIALEGAGLYNYGNFAAATSTNHLLGTTTADPEKVSTDPGSATYVADPIWCVGLSSGAKLRKGTLRWLLLVPAGNGTDTWKNKLYMQLTNAQPGMIGGPWDGSTAPSNS